MADCKHTSHRARVDVERHEDGYGVTYRARLHVHCADCGVVFHFPEHADTVADLEMAPGPAPAHCSGGPTTAKPLIVDAEPVGRAMPVAPKPIDTDPAVSAGPQSTTGTLHEPQTPPLPSPPEGG